MHLELADLFRCVAPHETTPLVAGSDRTEARAVVDGVLGCPLCGAEYPIVDGVVEYAAVRGEPGPAVAEGAEGDVGARAARVAALLDASDPRGTVVLVGASVALARAIQRLVPVRCVVVNAPDDARAREVAGHAEEPLAVLRCVGTVPLAAGSVRGVYIASTAAWIAADAVVGLLREGGRLVAPAETSVPAGMTELARDAAEWVAERRGGAEAPPALVTLRRRGSR